ncbi:MAG: SDR family NAD(P)-dependent oxidoreductase, partial [Aquabacterium sp.]|nr:SDR family NAD(P)-dependent oxidoreductase [Ferruginibacter sp.]
MEITLKGRKALVGGASRGLGKAIAIQLAACGAEVTIVARNEDKLKKALAELPALHGQQHQYLVIEYADFESFQNKFTTFFQTHQVDILINNTNGPAAGGVRNKTVDDYQQAFNLLCKTTSFLTAQVLPAMQQAGYGRIINLSSISVK